MPTEDSLFIVLYDGFPSERIYVVKASSKQDAIDKCNKGLDLILREEYETEEDFKAEVNIEDAHACRKFSVGQCAFDDDGVLIVYER